MQRRDFIRNIGLVSAGTFLIPSFLKAQTLIDSGKGFKRIVVIQFNGGNDGLSTVIPYSNDLYYKNRPSLGISKEKCIRLNDELGLNPNLIGFADLFHQGYVSIINSVGYPNPNRSHFRSMDIWQSASKADEYLSSGWVGRYLDQYGKSAHDIIEVDSTLSLTLKGEINNGLALQNAKAFYRSVREKYFDDLVMNSHSNEHHHDQVDYLYKTLINTSESARYIYETGTTYQTKKEYPQTTLGNRLKTIAEFINSGLETKIYYTSLSGFDTHAGQEGAHNKLMLTFSEALKIFIEDLKENNSFKDTLVLCFSEFGRRVEENASKGTDHGTANNLFIVAENLKKPGIYNAPSDLSDLDDGDLKYKIDFRRIYNEILEEWMQVNPELIITDKFERLGII